MDIGIDLHPDECKKVISQKVEYDTSHKKAQFKSVNIVTLRNIVRIGYFLFLTITWMHFANYLSLIATIIMIYFNIGRQFRGKIIQQKEY